MMKKKGRQQQHQGRSIRRSLSSSKFFHRRRRHLVLSIMATTTTTMMNTTILLYSCQRYSVNVVNAFSVPTTTTTTRWASSSIPWNLSFPTNVGDCGRHRRRSHFQTNRWSYPIGKDNSNNNINYDDGMLVETTTTTTRNNNNNVELYLPSHPNMAITNIMAPMVAASDYAFRCLCRDNGVQLTYTQMIHSKNFVLDNKFRQSHLDLWETGVTYPKFHPSQRALLGIGGAVTTNNNNRPSFGWNDNNQKNNHNHQHHDDVDYQPLIVQLAGNDVDMVVQAALMLYDHTDGKLSGIDLNCGCPQTIAKKGMYGAYLMDENPHTVYTILKTLRSQLPPTVAVSAKIRLPLDDGTLQDRINRLADTGIHFLTIHGRTLWENKTKVGACAIDRIQLAVDTMNNRIPIVANGGMEDYNDVQRILQSTGAVAAMSSEALLEIPDLFKIESLNVVTPSDRFDRQVSFAKQYLTKCSIVPPVPGVMGYSGSITIVRGHLFKFLHRYLKEQPDLRDRLAATTSNDGRNGGDVTTLDQAWRLVEELEERYSKFSDIEWSLASSSSPDSSWYRRHRGPDRKVHQKEVIVIRRKVGGRDVYDNSASGSTPSDMTNNSSTIDDRKRQIKERIEKLRAKRSDRKGVPVS